MASRGPGGDGGDSADATPSPAEWAWRHRWIALALVAAVGWWEALVARAPAALPPAARGSPEFDSRLILPPDVARSGNDAALAYLGTLDGGRTLRTIRAARAAVVRFRVERKGDGTDTTHYDNGTGILVNGGRHVLVAGHVLESAATDPEARLCVILPDGSRREGKRPFHLGGAEGAPAGDWGMVGLEGEPPQGCPSLPIGIMAQGATVVMLGYPGGIGIDASGTADWIWEAAASPVIHVGAVIDASTGTCALTAGAAPVGGTSGGAILDLQGNLVAIMVTTKSTWGSTSDRVVKVTQDGVEIPPPAMTGEERYYRVTFTGTTLDRIYDFIRESWKR